MALEKSEHSPSTFPAQYTNKIKPQPPSAPFSLALWLQWGWWLRKFQITWKWLRLVALLTSGSSPTVSSQVTQTHNSLYRIMCLLKTQNGFTALMWTAKWNGKIIIKGTLISEISWLNKHRDSKETSELHQRQRDRMQWAIRKANFVIIMWGDITDRSFLKHVQFLVVRNRELSEAKIPLFFLLESNYEYSHTRENWNNTLKDVNKIQHISQMCIYTWKWILTSLPEVHQMSWKSQKQQSALYKRAAMGKRDSKCINWSVW